MGRIAGWTWTGALAPVILAALKQYKAAPRMGMPARRDGWKFDDTENDFLTEAKWEAILDKMIAAFEMIVEDATGIAPRECATMADYQARDAEIARGLRLFGVYYRSLWD